MKKPDMTSLYGAAFGFNTDRRVKPVHFATGFFVSLLGRDNVTERLNNMVAFTDGKELAGNYGLATLHPLLVEEKRIGAGVAARELHLLRKHLRCLAANDGAVFPTYAKKAGFGCDYSTASQDMLTRTKDNDGFAGHFVRTVLSKTDDGEAVLAFAVRCLDQTDTTVRQVFTPLLDDQPRDVDVDQQYEAKFGILSDRRAKAVAKAMSKQTAALRTLCANADALAASETKLRFLVVGLCVWLFRYLVSEGLASKRDAGALLCDVTSETTSRMRTQSRWSYARLREELVAAFRRFDSEGRFADCQDAWEYVEEQLEGRPKFDDFYRELALRSGLAQPRASRIPAKHFEPQPDTLRILVLSVLPLEEGLVSHADVLERLYSTWGLCFGGRAEDPDLLAHLGYTGLDQDHDLAPNALALTELLTDLGLATRYSDGLVMCHVESRF